MTEGNIKAELAETIREARAIVDIGWPVMEDSPLELRMYDAIQRSQLVLGVFGTLRLASTPLMDLTPPTDSIVLEVLNSHHQALEGMYEMLKELLESQVKGYEMLSGLKEGVLELVSAVQKLIAALPEKDE